MINVAAIRMHQFGVSFYQASLSARDVDKLVRFEVLSYGERHHPPVRGRKPSTASKVNWDLLERRIAGSEKAYQRQIIRRKIEELVQYYEQCREARNLPSIPGAVIISSDEPLKFEPWEEGTNLGTLKVPEREGVLRAIDGQHRLLALHADIDRFGAEEFTVPAIIFDRLPEDHVVSPSTRSTRASTPRTSCRSRGASSTATRTWPRPTTWCARCTTARTRRSPGRSSCWAWATARWHRRRSPRSSRPCCSPTPSAAAAGPRSSSTTRSASS
jgi:hypothetical protein